MQALLATGNEGKAREFSELLPFVEFLTLKDFPGYPAIIEDGHTFEENALKKARIMCDYTGLVTLADDSGLEVDFLEGAPGIYSARFAGEPGNDDRNNMKLLELMKGIPKEKRTARFVCALALVMPDGTEQVVRGTCEGYILEELRGNQGFGYDPLFYYPPLDSSFGQLDGAAKNHISHRAKAIQEASQILKSVIVGK